MIKRLLTLLILILSVIFSFIITVFAIISAIPNWVITGNVKYSIDLAEKWYEFFTYNIINKIK